MAGVVAGVVGGVEGGLVEVSAMEVGDEVVMPVGAGAPIVSSACGFGGPSPTRTPRTHRRARDRAITASTIALDRRLQRREPTHPNHLHISEPMPEKASRTLSPRRGSPV